MTQYNLTHLDKLEAEAMFIMRESASQFERPALLFSGGKDSIVMGHIAKKTFYPSKVPFVFLHIDTGHNFPETLEYRDNFVKKIGAKLVIGSVEESIKEGRVIEETGKYASRNYLQTITLLDTVEKYKFDCLIGGGRRDEEKSRAKE
jgi:sulfate adenylyltransferase subunit 2